MKLNIPNVYNLMQERFNGNFNAFARALGVDPSHIHRVLTDGVGGGKKIIGAVIKYCKEASIDFSPFVILDDQFTTLSGYKKPICDCGNDLCYGKSTTSILRGGVGDNGFISNIIPLKQPSEEEYLLCENCGTKFEVGYYEMNRIIKGRRLNI